MHETATGEPLQNFMTTTPSKEGETPEKGRVITNNILAEAGKKDRLKKTASRDRVGGPNRSDLRSVKRRARSWEEKRMRRSKNEKLGMRQVKGGTTGNLG